MNYIRIFEEFKNYETIVVIGLPGSGKSHLAKEIKDKYPEKDFYIVEDAEYNKCAGMFKKNNMILADGYIIDISYFNAIMRDFTKENVEFSCYYFENNPEKCRINIESRKNHKIRAEVLIWELNSHSKIYDEIIEKIKKSPLLINIEEIPVFTKK